MFNTLVSDAFSMSYMKVLSGKSMDASQLGDSKTIKSGAKCNGLIAAIFIYPTLRQSLLSTLAG